jgi:hypothetical protein
MKLQQHLRILTTTVILWLPFVTSNTVYADMANANTPHHPSHKTNTNYAIKIPQRGMDKELVYAHFGTPQRETQAVGEPPISLWIFKDFTVYFEHDYVIHTVRHHTIPPQQQSTQ